MAPLTALCLTLSRLVTSAAEPLESLQLAVEPAELSLDVHTTVTVRVHAVGHDVADLEAVAEAGTVGDWHRSVDGSFTATWQLPADLTPRRVGLAIRDRRQDLAVFTTVALARRARFSIKTRPRARVRLLLEHQEVAAATADDDGRALVNLLVPAGKNGIATVEHWLGNTRFQVETMQLGTGDALHLFAVATSAHRLYAWGYRDSGRPLQAATLQAYAGNQVTTAEPLGTDRWQLILPSTAEHEALTVGLELHDGALMTRYELAVTAPTNSELPADSRSQMTLTTSRWPWNVSAAVGLAADGELLKTGWFSVGAELLPFATLPALGLAGDLALTLPTEGESLSGGSATNTTLTRERYWLVPFTLAVRGHWPLHSEWVLGASAGGGLLLAAAKRSRTTLKNNRVHSDTTDLTTGAELCARVELGYHLGPGWLLGQLGGQLLLVAPASVTLQRLWGTLAVAYRLEISQ